MRASDFQPTSMAETTLTAPLSKFTPVTLIFFAKQLQALLGAGVPLLQALQLLIEQLPKQHNLLQQLSLDIRNGRTFADSLRAHPASFDKLFCDLIEIGEWSGRLEQILGQLIDEREARIGTEKKLRKALFYPIFILLVALLVSIGLLLFVVPKFAAIFADFGADLPAFTLAVITIAASIKSHAIKFVLTFSGVVMICVWSYKHSYPVRLWWHRQSLRLPVIGSLLYHAFQARMAHTLSTSLAAGVILPQALKATARTTPNKQLQKQWTLVIQAVQKGIALPAAFHHTSLFDATSLAMIRLGHETGQLDTMLAQIGLRQRQTLAELTERLTQYLEPLIMLVVGAFVAIIMVAMYLPIFQLGQVIN